MAEAQREMAHPSSESFNGTLAKVSWGQGATVQDLRQELFWPDFLGWSDSWKRGFVGQQRRDLVDNYRVFLPGREGEIAHARVYFDILRSHESLFHPLNMIESLKLQRDEPGFQC